MQHVENTLRSCQTRSRGFLHDLQVLETDAQSTTALIARFDQHRYGDDVFDALGIHCPERLTSAVIKRRAEFLAGRALSQACLSLLNRSPVEIATGPNREPIWPKGIVGSITHSKGRCAAILSKNADLLIGVDIEEVANGSALDSIFHVTLQPDETDLIQTQDALTTDMLATLVFSAKETLYKALFPIVQQFFGFDHAELDAVPRKNRLRLRLTKPLGDQFRAGACFDVRYSQVGSSIITWLVAPKPVLGR